MDTVWFLYFHTLLITIAVYRHIIEIVTDYRRLKGRD